jgi:hypothetical protein
LKLKIVVDQTQSEFQEPTQDGGRSSGIEDTTSSMLEITRFGMFQVEKIKKDKEFGSGIDTTVLIRDGELSILTNHQEKQHVDMTENMDSTS